MKRIIYSLAFSVVIGLFFALPAAAQSSTFKDSISEYTFELPEPLWKMNLKPTEKDPNPQYIYGDRLNGYLQIDKVSVKPNSMLEEQVRSLDASLQFKIGYIAGKEESFAGALKGKVFNYEFVQAGKKMSGRVYLLKSDASTVYTLQFTGLRDQLKAIRNQTDSIARTFKVNKTA